jgi:hypothetical protein
MRDNRSTRSPPCRVKGHLDPESGAAANVDLLDAPAATHKQPPVVEVHERVCSDRFQGR